MEEIASLRGCRAVDRPEGEGKGTCIQITDIKMTKEDANESDSNY